MSSAEHEPSAEISAALSDEESDTLSIELEQPVDLPSLAPMDTRCEQQGFTVQGKTKHDSHFYFPRAPATLTRAQQRRQRQTAMDTDELPGIAAVNQRTVRVVHRGFFNDFGDLFAK